MVTATAGRRLALGAQGPAFFQSVQHRVDHTFPQRDGLTRCIAYRAHEFVAVHLTLTELLQ